MPVPEYHDLHRALAAVGQDHVFAYWPNLDATERKSLLADLARINLAELPTLAKLAANPPPTSIQGKIDPAAVITNWAEEGRAVACGQAALADGRVAALTVAGGQGTRLGFDGPKGALPVTPIRRKSLFQLFAEAILATGRKYGRPVPWYVMTSPANHAQTQAFFQQHACFGLRPDLVQFFEQGVMPAFDRQGRILLDQPHRVALAPDGHGGTLLALAASGMLADMAARGIEHISYFQVDNPLVRCLDPAFLGLHELNDSEMSSKAVPKADDLEKVGNFVLLDGRLCVIEYSDLPDEVARQRTPAGRRRFDAANIAVHILSRRFVERLTADRAAFALPWHRAQKKVPHVDLASGRRIEPTEPDSIKLEAFIFDALPLARRPIVAQTSRAEEFSPVKNPTGVDSIETARLDQLERSAAWLESAGFQVPRRPDGRVDAKLEISPLVALDRRELAEKVGPPRALRPGEVLCLG